MFNRMRSWFKAATATPQAARRPYSSVGGMVSRSPGWWRDDSVEQLRNYQSWVYAAVNAIAQEVARQRPFLFVNTGQADHEQTPLPHTHPLARLLDYPNPWMTPWELWYLTILYLELTGNCYWYAAPRANGHARRTLDRADAVGAHHPRPGSVREGLRGRLSPACRPKCLPPTK